MEKIESVRPLLLVIEDESDQLANLQDILSSTYDLLLAQTVEDAIRQYKSHSDKINLILTDMKLYQSTAQSFRDALDLSGDSIAPILVLSAYSFPEDVVHSITVMGAFDHIEKPYSISFLKEKIKEALEEAPRSLASRCTDAHFLQKSLQERNLLFPESFVSEINTNESMLALLEADTGSHAPDIWAPKILIVEDEADLQDTLKELLASGHRNILTASTAQEALSQLKFISDIDVVLLDIGLPGLSGEAVFETIHGLSKQARHFDAPSMIVYSGYSDHKTVVAAARAGVERYLVKPSSNTDIVEAIETCFKTRLERYQISFLLSLLRAKLGK